MIILLGPLSFFTACDSFDGMMTFDEAGRFVVDTFSWEDEADKRPIVAVDLDQEAYDRTFFNTLVQLREMHFIPDRQDRRMGVITALPRESATFITPYPSNHETAGQYAEATLNHQRRVVRVLIEEKALPSGQVPTTQSAEPMPKYYVLRAEIWIQHRVFPERALTNQEKPQYGEDPILTEKGPVKKRWVNKKRDGLVESYLLRRIAQRSGLAIEREHE